VSARHSFGLARAEVIAAFVNSLALLAVVAWLVVEGIDRIRHPIRVNGAAVLLIAGVGLAVNLSIAWALAQHRENLTYGRRCCTFWVICSARSQPWWPAR